MKLLLAYLFSAAGIFFPSKNIQWLCIFTSIIIYFIFSTYYQIGGDYKSLQFRADNTYFGDISWNTDLVFEIFVQLSKIIGIDLPIIYSVCMLILLPYNFYKPAITLFALIISFYFLITGFQRQALAAMVLLRFLKFEPKSLNFFGYIISFLVHKSVIILSGIALISSRPRSRVIAIVIGAVIFLMVIIMQIALKETFLNHYLEYYFSHQMKSSGASLRALAIISVYFILCFNRDFDRDSSSTMFEITIVISILMIISGATTAGDRMLIYCIAILVFSNIVSSASELRLVVASVPFLTMNLFWIYASKQAQVNW